MLHNDRVRSALRFAITLAVTDILLITLFGSTTAAVLGSFAVIAQLYFMDFDGDARQRAIGHTAAGLAGIVAVVLGTLASRPVWLAVIATLMVSGLLAYSRVLRGYVARASIGLQAAYFLPLIAAPELTELPSLIAAWALGAALSIVAALILLPHRSPGLVRAGLGAWLRAAAHLTQTIAGQRPAANVSEVRQDLMQARDRLLAVFTNSVIRPGVLDRRQWALSEMVDRVLASMPLIDIIATSPPVQPTELAASTTTGFQQAATLVTNGKVDQPLVDLAHVRKQDLQSLIKVPPAALQTYYVIRLLSIGAMSQLWLAAMTRGLSAPRPDVGQLPSQTAGSLLRANARWRSVWFQNALRTAIGTSVCVLLVRELDLEHGLWVVLAALTCIQGTFSAPATVRSMAMIVLGSVAGVCFAATLTFTRPAEWLLPVLLFALAMAAKFMQSSGTFLSQFLYTPMALVNLTLLSWPPQRGVLEVRVEDVFLGCLVAALLTIAVFPLGVRPLLKRLEGQAQIMSMEYLAAAIAQVRQCQAPQTHPEPGTTDLDDHALDQSRQQCADAILAYENTLDTAYMQISPQDSLAQFDRQSALTRDRLTGGDVCRQLARDQALEPALAPVAIAFADWWRSNLLTARS